MTGGGAPLPPAPPIPAARPACPPLPPRPPTDVPVASPAWAPPLPPRPPLPKPTNPSSAPSPPFPPLDVCPPVAEPPLPVATVAAQHPATDPTHATATPVTTVVPAASPPLPALPASPWLTTRPPSPPRAPGGRAVGVVARPHRRDLPSPGRRFACTASSAAGVARSGHRGCRHRRRLLRRATCRIPEAAVLQLRPCSRLRQNPLLPPPPLSLLRLRSEMRGPLSPPLPATAFPDVAYAFLPLPPPALPPNSPLLPLLPPLPAIARRGGGAVVSVRASLPPLASTAGHQDLSVAAGAARGLPPRRVRRSRSRTRHRYRYRPRLRFHIHALPANPAVSTVTSVAAKQPAASPLQHWWLGRRPMRHGRSCTASHPARRAAAPQIQYSPPLRSMRAESQRPARNPQTRPRRIPPHRRPRRRRAPPKRAIVLLHRFALGRFGRPRRQRRPILISPF